MTARRSGSLSRFVILLLIGSLVPACSTDVRVFNALGVGVAATDAEGNPTEILVTDMGGELLACPEPNDSKIITLDMAGNILWSFDAYDSVLQGAHTAEFNAARDKLIISDTCNDRILIISYPGGAIEWDSSTACPDLDLLEPNNAKFLDSGNLLITDRDHHIVIEIDPVDCSTVWSFGVWGVQRGRLMFDDPIHLLGPHESHRLPNGNTLIADSGEFVAGDSRIIEVDPSGQIVWSYKKNTDCTVLGEYPKACPCLEWARDAFLECDDPSCETGVVFVTGMHQTVAVPRDLNAEPFPGEDAPRGRVVTAQMQHGAGLCYDADMVPRWQGATNGGLGFYLVSNHGPYAWGSWVRAVPVDVPHSDTGHIWQVNGWR